MRMMRRRRMKCLWILMRMGERFGKDVCAPSTARALHLVLSATTHLAGTGSNFCAKRARS